jgi:hypothetical protein
MEIGLGEIRAASALVCGSWHSGIELKWAVEFT